MRLRLPMLAAALTAALALPAAAQAATPTLPVPCLDAAGIAIPGCTPVLPAPAKPAAGASCPGRDLTPTAQNLAAVRTATVCLVNEQRTKHGLKPLKSVATLQGVAATYAKRMVKEQFFDHTSPKGDTFLTRIKHTSYLTGTIRSWSVGENLAWGEGTLATPDAIVQAWMKSPGHRRNILTAGFSELGMGVALGAPVGGTGATYVNEFGARHR